MIDSKTLSRRGLLASPAILALAGTAACAAPGGTAPVNAAKVLVAYFTRSGNTKVIAGTTQRALGADLFEIHPATGYPEDYEATVAQATRERDRGVEPALARLVANLAQYEAIFLGFPIWGETAPPVIRSFLKLHDLRGKTLRPFITHGGYGVGGSLAVLASHAPGARIEPPFVMEADQERRTLNQVKGWLARIEGSDS
ncbi:MAG: flavodoxin [Pseudomonadota bacterium]